LFGALAAAFLLAGPAGGAVEATASQDRRGDLVCDLLKLVLPLDCDTPPPAATPATPPPGATPAAPPAAGANEPPPQPVTAQSVETLTSVPVRHSSMSIRYRPGRLAVAFQRGTARRTIAKIFAAAGVTVERAIPVISAYQVRVDPDRLPAAATALRASPAVISADRDPIVTALDTVPNDTFWPQAWGLKIVGFPGAWDLTRGSAGVIVAVVDTGVDPAQQELRGALVPGYDFVNSDADPRDDHGHGTAAAGVIGARTDNREGITGACWQCSIMPVKVLDAQGVGDDSLIAAGIVWAADHGARVINLSLGGPGTTQVLGEAIAHAVARGAVVIGAAGNSGTTVPYFPAADPNALSVAGTTRIDKAYDWSNHGSWVEVAAPGCNPALDRGQGYVIFCGTSSATPVVSGLAALAVAVNPAATPQEIEQMIEHNAVSLRGVVQYGRVRARETVQRLAAEVQPNIRVVTTTFAGAVGARTSMRTYPVSVGNGPVTAKLSFKAGARLSLALLRENASKPVTRTLGRSPLQLTTTVQAGRLRLLVAGRAAKTPFVLTVTFVKAAA